MNQGQKRERELLRLLNEDVSAGMERLIDLYGGAVKKICLSIMNGFSQEDIEEAISDTFVALWLAREKVEVAGECGIKNYLYGIARKTALNRRRKIMHAREFVTTDELEQMDEQDALIARDNVEDEVLKKSEYVVLHQLIEEMRSPDCEIFKYRYFEENSVKEIAERLNLTTKVVENRLYRGKSDLKKQLILCGINMEVQ